MAGTASNSRRAFSITSGSTSCRARALAISHRIRNITWRVTQGMLGARLQLALLPERRCRRESRGAEAALFVAVRPRRISLPVARIAFRPAALPDRRVVRHVRFAAQGAQCAPPHRGPHRAVPFVARNRRRSRRPCPGCPVGAGTAARATADPGVLSISRGRSPHCASFAFLPGPMTGPSGFASAPTCTSSIDGATWERRGTSAEIHAALETRAVDFDVKIFRLLAKTLRKLPRTRIVLLASRPRRRSRSTHRSDLVATIAASGE